TAKLTQDFRQTLPSEVDHYIHNIVNLFCNFISQLYSLAAVKLWSTEHVMAKFYVFKRMSIKSITPIV
uniref:hypothetical protein n=1 Tax=Acinetobacter baumannii TaxID=470 RepID=UPI001C06F726